MFVSLLLLFSTISLAGMNPEVKVGGHRVEVTTTCDVTVTNQDQTTSINAEGVGKISLEGLIKDIVIKKHKEDPKKEKDSECIIM